MSGSFTLPLRPQRQKASREDDLAVKIAQLQAQKGSFRGVTEESLLAEIEAERDTNQDELDDSDRKTGDDEDQNREEQLFKSRHEITQFAMNAHAESSYALEYISLLLSRYTPRQAEVSMSPLLKQKVPLGSLAADQTKPPEQPEARKRDIGLVSRGWKLESFDAAATKLLQSAERLERDIAAETNYWSGILKIKEKGWKVCKIPREKQTLGVQYGFLESAPIFRDRGLAALRKGENGRLVLDRGIRAKPPRMLRIRIKEGSRTVGLSVAAKSEQTDESLDGPIREARDSLFEEELYYELNREARTILRHGVDMRRDLIKFLIDDTKEVLIDLVGLDAEPSESETHLNPANNFLADSISKSLRVLLSRAHRKTHERRTRMPLPLTLNKRPTPEYQLIRPVLCYLQHKSHYQWFASLFDSLSKIFHSAGLKCSYNLNPLVKESRKCGEVASSVESFLDTLVNPLESIILCTLVSPNSMLRLRITTNVDPNGFGSEFELITNLSRFPAQQRPFRFGSREDMQNLIYYLFSLDLVYLIPSLVKRPNDMPMALGPLGPLASLGSGSWEAQLLAEESFTNENEPAPNPNGVYMLPWQPTFPHQGELTTFSPMLGRTKKLCIQLEHDRLRVKCFWVGRKGLFSKTEARKEQPGEKAFTWTALGVEGQPDTASITLQKALEIFGERETDKENPANSADKSDVK